MQCKTLNYSSVSFLENVFTNLWGRHCFRAFEKRTPGSIGNAVTWGFALKYKTGSIPWETFVILGFRFHGKFLMGRFIPGYLSLRVLSLVANSPYIRGKEGPLFSKGGFTTRGRGGWVLFASPHSISLSLSLLT